mmetsp:Transcript_42003/g.91107  ORF Transcript_42003/g.91107 Transcript_42003/m.91107 type:complete len:300 (-) Transcript_42003:1553-2452(-)
MAFTLRRTRSASSSFSSTPRASTTSPSLSRRIDLLALMLNSSVRAAVFTTFMSFRMWLSKVSLFTLPSASSSQCLKSLFNSSSFRAVSSPSPFASGSFAAVSKNLRNEASLVAWPSSISHKVAQSSSERREFRFRWCLKRSVAVCSTASSSARSLLFMVSRNLLQALLSIVKRGSSLACLISTGRTSFNNQAATSLSTSFTLAKSFLMFSTSSFTALSWSSISSAKLCIWTAFMSLPLACKGRPSSSTLATDSSASLTRCETSSTCVLKPSLTFSISFSCASRRFLRCRSFARSRAMPI